jgi:hypothetical protein
VNGAAFASVPGFSLTALMAGRLSVLPELLLASTTVRVKIFEAGWLGFC